jgi:hypothetical protein
MEMQQPTSPEAPSTGRVGVEKEVCVQPMRKIDFQTILNLISLLRMPKDPQK